MPNNTRMFTRGTPLIFLSVSFLIWLICFAEFLTGRISLTADTFTNYSIIKYYFNNLLNGAFPLLDPYIYLGRPFMYSGSSGALNPFAYIIPVLVWAKFNFLQAYLVFTSGYYFLGVVGFYLLVKKILNSRFEALIG